MVDGSSVRADCARPMTKTIARADFGRGGSSRNDCSMKGLFWRAAFTSTSIRSGPAWPRHPRNQRILRYSTAFDPWFRRQHRRRRAISRNRRRWRLMNPRVNLRRHTATSRRLVVRADDSGGPRQAAVPSPAADPEPDSRPIRCAGHTRTVTASAHRPCGPSFQSRLPAHEPLRVSFAGRLDGTPNSRGKPRNNSGRACTDSRPTEIERRQLDRDGAVLRPMVQAGRGRPYLDEKVCRTDRSLLVPRPACSRGRISLLTPGRLERAPAPGLPVLAMAIAIG